MLKSFLLLACFFSLLSCKDKLYVDEIDKTRFDKYFTLKISSYERNGTKGISVSPNLNYFPGDKVSSFIQNHSHRFDYLMNKTYFSILHDKIFDSIKLISTFSSALNTDSFYRRFVLLTSGDRNQDNSKMESFSITEMMTMASRFFICDQVRERDTSISSYHTCVGINGISELKPTKDCTALEAFCFEAIFRNLNRHHEYTKNFDVYIDEASKIEKKTFKDFRSFLNGVKNRCFASMENDKDLEKMLLTYYKENVDNFNFKIE